MEIFLNKEKTVFNHLINQLVYGCMYVQARLLFSLILFFPSQHGSKFLVKYANVKDILLIIPLHQAFLKHKAIFYESYMY